MFSKDEFIKVSEPWQILSKTLYETYRYYAKNKYWSVIWDAKNKRQRIGKEEYDELNGEGAYDEKYKLSPIYDSEYDTEDEEYEECDEYNIQDKELV